MRIRFDNAMSQSNAYIMEEWKAMGTARRLQAENDQLLDALLDFNNQPRVPARQRFDLSAAGLDAASNAANSTPNAAGPRLSTEAAQQRLGELREQLNAGAITPDQYAQQADALHSAQVQQVLTSLDGLEASVPHTTVTDVAALPDGIDLSDHAPGYMSPAHEEEYLLALDQLLEDPAFEQSTAHHRTFHLGPSQPPLSEKDLTIRNPDSVYNWLRKNQPQVFLQDKDAAAAAHHDNASEKAAAPKNSKKSRQSNIGGGGTPGPKEDHDAEDSAAPEGGRGGRGKKAAADPDDTAYRPKGGSSRPAKRKREAADGEAKSKKKSRPSAAATAAAANASAAAAAAAAAAATATPATPTPAAPAPPSTGQ
jgi:hypothetical protein